MGKEKSVIQYSIGDNKSPVDLCALLPNENESFSLSRELGCNDNSVEFSVTGDRVIDLTGYLQIDNPNRRNSIKMPHESYVNKYVFFFPLKILFMWLTHYSLADSGERQTPLTGGAPPSTCYFINGRISRNSA